MGRRTKIVLTECRQTGGGVDRVGDIIVMMLLGRVQNILPYHHHLVYSTDAHVSSVDW